MNIENEIFKKSVINYEKLISYGFTKTEDKYKISKNILDDTFRIDIEISISGEVTGKIYDLSFDEEYTNYRIENQVGEFVSKVREEFKSFLNEIKEKCTSSNYFISNQSNRITNIIIDKYGDIPEFPWDDLEDAGIFRNPDCQKWYGLIMNIDKSKLDKKESGSVEIINVKLDENEIQELLTKKGYYKAYHMNKVKWITMTLDDTLTDEEIMSRIEESHKFTESNHEWLIPANPKYYDVINCFNETDTITWKQSNKISIGDIVYLYVGSPYSCILYKCVVTETDIPYTYIDKNLSMSKVMRIELLKRYNKDEFTFDILKKYGVNSIRGPRSITKELSEELKTKKINTSINLIDNSSKILKVPATIILEDKSEYITKTTISLTYNQKEYKGEGNEYLWEDAFANLQKSLPENVKIACCMTCQHGNMCPYGNSPRELYCTKNIEVNDKYDLENIFNKDNFYENNRVLSDHYCEDYVSQSNDTYTYNDYKYVSK